MMRMSNRSVTTYEYNQGSFLKHFLKHGTSIVIEAIIPSAPNNENPAVLLAKPEVSIVFISINNPNGMKKSSNIKGKTIPINHKMETRFDMAFLNPFFIPKPP
jgi:hypothetical protein